MVQPGGGDWKCPFCFNVNHTDIDECLKCDAKKAKRLFTAKEKEIIKYCESEEKFTWAAQIMGIVLECDFRETLGVLRDLRKVGTDI